MKYINSEIDFSLITICKGRLEYLYETLYYYLDQDYKNYEVIVVDYGCTEHTGQEVQEFLTKIHPTIDVKVVHVLEDTDLWNASKARNIGAKYARGERLVFMDCDVRPPLWFLKYATKFNHLKLVKTGGSGVGSCIIDANTLQDLRGYDEDNIGWGCEDTDLYERFILKYGEPALGKYSKDILRVWAQTSKQKIRYTNFKTQDEGLQTNRARIKVAGKVTNPEGFAKQEVAIYQYDPSNNIEEDSYVLFNEVVPNDSKINFAILSTPRTGSTNLVYTLNKHKDIHCESEIFGEWDFERVADYSTKSFELSIEDFNLLHSRRTDLLKYYLNNPDIDTQAIGFKLLPVQFSAMRDVERIHALDLKVIYLYRRNYFDKLLSFVYARATSVWQDKTTEVTDGVVTIDLKSLNQWLLSNYELEKKMHDLVIKHDPSKVMTISFKESLTQKGINKACKFIGVKPKRLENHFKEAYFSDEHFEKHISNYKEVAKGLRDFIRKKGLNDFLSNFLEQLESLKYE